MTFKILLRVILILLFSAFITNIQAFAITPEEYCTIHNESGAPGSCAEKGSCAVITTNLGTEECKLCGEGGCELIKCVKCEEEKEKE